MIELIRLFQEERIMRPIETINELKAIQLGILKEVKRFCDNNKINYMLIDGTLLGAVRHKGFIPWDDDIDIAMTRENYDKFSKMFNASVNKRYSFHCYENDKTYAYPMGKVYDDNTVLYEMGRKNGYKIAVYIDVFVFDSIPDNSKIIKRLCKRRDFYLHLRTLQKSTEHKGNCIRRAIVYAIGKILSFIPTRFLTGKVVNNGKKFRYDRKTSCYGSLTDDFYVVMKKELLDSVVKLEFEDELFSVPIGYKEFLESVYGDYMTPPPEDKRIAHHRIDAFILND